MRHWLFVAVLAFVPIANAEDYRTNCSPAAGGYQYGMNCQSSSLQRPTRHAGLAAGLNKISEAMWIQMNQPQPQVVYVVQQPTAPTYQTPTQELPMPSKGLCPQCSGRFRDARYCPYDGHPLLSENV